jgi:tetratricopeptide (TPR) repeat protein
MKSRDTIITATIIILSTALSFSLGLGSASLSSVVIAVGHVDLPYSSIIYGAAVISVTLTFLLVRAHLLKFRRSNISIKSRNTAILLCAGKIITSTLIVPLIIGFLIIPYSFAYLLISESIDERRLGDCKPLDASAKIECYSDTIMSKKLSGELLAKAYERRAIAYKGLARNSIEDEDARRKFLLSAIDDYNHALEIEPNNPHFYNSRGVAYEKLGDKSHAIKDFRKALEISPGMWRSEKNLRRLLEGSGMRDLQSKPAEPYTPPTPSVDLSELSDEEICRAAIYFDGMNDRYTWRPKAFPHVDEAVRRDYTSKDCARLLGLSVEPGTSDLPKPSKAPTSTGALTERSDEDICRSTIHFDEKYKYYTWRPGAYRSFLEEAGRRGYTATKCAKLLGFLKN